MTNDFPPRTGGIETFVTAIAERMDPEEVVIYTARQPDGSGFDRRLPYPVVRDPSPLLVPAAGIAGRVARAAARHRCDAAWFASAAPLALMAGGVRRAGVERSVATTHGHEIWWSTVPWMRPLMRRIGERVDVLTAYGDYCASRIGRALTPAARAGMQRFTPGVDVTQFHPGSGGEEVRRRHGLSDRPVIVCVSRLVTRKGQDVLLEVLPRVQARVPGAALLLVGDGPRRRDLERTIRRSGLERDVVLAGSVPWHDTPAYYDAGDVFAMPTRTRLGGLEAEALGICYLEAAATGLPVVAGDSGGAPDAVLDGASGYVTPGRSVDQVADRLVDLLLDRAKAKRFGECGRMWMEHAWGWDERVDELHRLLDPSCAPSSDDIPPTPPT